MRGDEVGERPRAVEARTEDIRPVEGEAHLPPRVGESKVSECEVPPLSHCIVVVVLGGELDSDILEDIHVRDDLVAEALYRCEPAPMLEATAVQAPRDVVLHREP